MKFMKLNFVKLTAQMFSNICFFKSRFYQKSSYPEHISQSFCLKWLNISWMHCCVVKSVCIRSFFGPHFPAFRANTERYGVSLRIQYKCGKIQTRKTPNTDIFDAVQDSWKNLLQVVIFSNFVGWLLWIL